MFAPSRYRRCSKRLLFTSFLWSSLKQLRSGTAWGWKSALTGFLLVSLVTLTTFRH